MKKEISKKFEITNSNHIIIECKVNGVNCRSIIDTGASNSCINFFSASKFNIDFKKSNSKASSATEEINEIFYSKNNILEVEDFKKNNFEIILFDMSYINNSLKEKEVEEVDGIIGSDILKEFNTIINYKNKTITLKL